MPYRWVVGDLRTGKITRTVDGINPTWSASFDGADTLGIEIPTRAVKHGLPAGPGQGPPGQGIGGQTVIPRRSAWRTVRADTAPARNFLAVAWVDKDGNEHWIAGGPIWTRTRKRSDGLVKLGAGGLWSYWDHRKLLPVFATNADVAKLTSSWSADQYALIAKRMIQQAQAETTGQVPVVLPSDTALGGPGTRYQPEYPGHELATVGERLRQLSRLADGPEIQFVPRRKVSDPRYMEWVMDAGVQPTMMLTQDGAPWVFNDTVPNSPVLDVENGEDATVLGTRAFAAGQGQGTARPIKVAVDTYLTDLGYPLLDVEATRTDSLSTDTTLQGHADGLLLASSRPVETTTVTFGLSEFWRRYPTFRPGDMAKLTVPADDWDDGTPDDLRSLVLKGGDNSSVSVACAPRKGDL